MTAERFPRSLRLTKADEFRRAFRQGRRVSDSLFTVVAVRNGSGCARLGLAVSRKAARRAVDRNRIKRVVRDAFRRGQVRLSGFDVVVLARPAARSETNAALRLSLTTLWQRLPGSPTGCSAREAGE